MNFETSHPWILGLSLLGLSFCTSDALAEMSQSEDPLESGIAFFSDNLFESQSLAPLAGGDFEEGLGEWVARGLQIEATTAFSGKSGLGSDGATPASLRLAGVPVKSPKTYRLSFRVRTANPMRLRIAFPDASNRWGRNDWATIPPSQSEWRWFHFFFRAPEGARFADITLSQDDKESSPTPVALDDITMTEVSEATFATGYQTWRNRFPIRDLSPRPEDGKSLEQTIRKLRDPDRETVLIWAIGSSYTNMLGMGETLRQVIHERFPNAPRIIYRKHVGSAVSWKYIQGWYRHQVVSEQPDVILIYAIGSPEDLDQLLTEIRATSTADIIVPSIHWRMRDAPLWGQSEDAADQDVNAIRKVCQKHQVEFVENRREWAAYMIDQGYTLEIDPARGLLKDDVHQSDYGALVINENIVRHFNPGVTPAESNFRERRIVMTPGGYKNDRDEVNLIGDWTDTSYGLASVTPGSTISIRFVGNRVDLIGHRTGSEGGELLVKVNGKPASVAGGYFLGAIIPDDKNRSPTGRGLSGDFAPHGIEPGETLIPQNWEIRMLDDMGHYELIGSVTGPDGHGHVEENFESDSGQIRIPSALWRQATVRANDGGKRFSNREGDVFRFTVTSAAEDKLSFAGKEGETFRVTLAANLRNTQNEIELVTTNDGKVEVEGFEVFTPPISATNIQE